METRITIETTQELISNPFLQRIGWIIKEELPLVIHYTWNTGISCSFGKYGYFSIKEYHWMNEGEVVREFTTINHKLSVNDYYDIIKMLGIKMKKEILIND